MQKIQMENMSEELKFLLSLLLGLLPPIDQAYDFAPTGLFLLPPATNSSCYECLQEN
jgi:hypothetical protein